MAHSSSPKGHHDNAHEPHVIPLAVYFKVLAVLLVLTVITVAASRVNFGPWNTVIAMLIASVKAGFVLSIFMHLKYDDKLYWVCFGTAIFFLIVLYFFSWLDILTRVLPENIL
jgi:cytochrome c oxidase subunit IV